VRKRGKGNRGGKGKGKFGECLKRKKKEGKKKEESRKKLINRGGSKKIKSKGVGEGILVKEKRRERV
jgi:hypothetical protein